MKAGQTHYVHLKRVAGDSGECYQSLNTLAKKTQTSKPTLIKAKQELINHGLIRVRPAERGDKPDPITIRNVWRRNIDHFDRGGKRENHPPVSGFTTPGKGENPKKNTSKKNPSKNIESSEQTRKEAEAARRRKQMEEVFGPDAT